MERKMIINVIGLGLIGGSFCKAIKAQTAHTCLGLDIDQEVLRKALDQGAIDAAGEDLGRADLSIVCLYPEAALDFLTANRGKFKKGSLVIDACGIKTAIVSRVTDVLAENGVVFIGAHPMAGREFSGFDYSTAALFENASLILTPREDTPADSLALIRTLAEKLLFKKVVVATPEEHDRIIAYTSQLAHIVSNAYIKSPTLSHQLGFSAGSFKDLTRVAKLNEDMWTSLFLMNREPLLDELDILMDNLLKYRQALEADDAQELNTLLRHGRILKEKSMSEKL